MPRLSLVAHLGWITAGAVLLDLSSLNRYHNADSLVPVLCSLTKWTFFYWQHNRYGMLTPLLATPFDDPMTNLLVQNAITAWAGLAVFPLAARYLFRDSSWRVVGPLAAAAFVAFAHSYLQWQFFSTVNVFAVSMACGLAGLLCVSDGGPAWPWIVRQAAALALILVGAWVNGALGLALAPLAVTVALVRARNGDRRAAMRDAISGVLLCVISVIAALLLQKAVTIYQTTQPHPPHPALWGDLLHVTAQSYFEECDSPPWLVCLAAAIIVGSVLVLVPRTRGVAWGGVGLGFAAITASLVYAGAMSVLFFAQYRYSIPAMILVHVAILGWAVRALLAVCPPIRGVVEIVGGLAVLAAIVSIHGEPSIQGAEAAICERHRGGAEIFVQTRCTHIAGSYWKVWPMVFVVNLEHRRRGDDLRVWGLSYRSEATRELWSEIPPEATMIGAYTNDPEGVIRMREFQKTGVRPFGRKEPIDFFRPVPE